MTTVLILIGAAGVIAAWRLWCSLDVTEMMSCEWLDNWKRENYGQEDNQGVSEAEDIAEATRLREGVLETYQAEDARDDQDALDDFYPLDGFNAGGRKEDAED